MCAACVPCIKSCNRWFSPIQVDCAPQGNIVIRVLQYRQDAGGYLKVAPLQTAGIGAVKGVGFRASGATVGLPHAPQAVVLHFLYAFLHATSVIKAKVMRGEDTLAYMASQDVKIENLQLVRG